jgi:hypothetical protein
MAVHAWPWHWTVWHWPPTQDFPLSHLLPHPPQSSGFESVFTHVPLQHIS